MEIGAFNRKSEGNCILVGLQMDAIGRELLNWAITKLAEQGDRIVAVHICRKSSIIYQESPKFTYFSCLLIPFVTISVSLLRSLQDQHSVSDQGVRGLFDSVREPVWYEAGTLD